MGVHASVNANYLEWLLTDAPERADWALKTHVYRDLFQEERPGLFVAGSGGSIRIYGDGHLLAESPIFYAKESYPIKAEVHGVKRLRLIGDPFHQEKATAPHRRAKKICRHGFPRTPL